MTCHNPMLTSLREHGVRLTAQRALILEDLYHNPGHCTAEEIYARVGQNLPGLNRATVYRTLELLRGRRGDGQRQSRGGDGFELVRDVNDSAPPPPLPRLWDRDTPGDGTRGSAESRDSPTLRVPRRP